MQVTLDIKYLSDLEILRPILERLEITIVTPIQPNTVLAKKEQLPLAKFINTLPSLNISNFENYLEQTRNEWERPIF